MKNMRKSKMMMALAAMTVTTFMFTSCDDRYDRWDHGWNDPYGWYNGYSDWNWSDDDWNDGKQDSQNSQLVQLANKLMGEWYGTAQFSYLNDDGESRTTLDFNVDMKFFQYGNSGNKLSGYGIENDYKFSADGTKVDDQQTLNFSWYIGDNGDIYIKYDNGGTYAMDASAKYYGYYLGRENNQSNDVFYGYMIGLDDAQGKLMNINLERVNSTSNAKGNATASSKVNAMESLSFGKLTVNTPFTVTVNDGKLSRNR